MARRPQVLPFVTLRSASAGENVAAGNKMYGIAFAGGSNHVADNNTIGGNDWTGLLAVSPEQGTTLSNVDLLNNWVGLTRDEQAVPNGRAGIWGFRRRNRPRQR